MSAVVQLLDLIASLLSIVLLICLASLVIDTGISGDKARKYALWSFGIGMGCAVTKRMILKS